MPYLIAGHCQISVRKLRDIFSVSSETLTSYIREQRLLRCREALRASSMRSKSVFDIALKWGFNDPAYFSRVYRNRFGVSPTSDRRLESNWRRRTGAIFRPHHDFSDDVDETFNLTIR